MRPWRKRGRQGGLRQGRAAARRQGRTGAGLRGRVWGLRHRPPHPRPQLWKRLPRLLGGQQGSARARPVELVQEPGQGQGRGQERGQERGWRRGRGRRQGREALLGLQHHPPAAHLRGPAGGSGCGAQVEPPPRAVCWAGAAGVQSWCAYPVSLIWHGRLGRAEYRCQGWHAYSWSLMLHGCLGRASKRPAGTAEATCRVIGHIELTSLRDLAAILSIELHSSLDSCNRAFIQMLLSADCICCLLAWWLRLYRILVLCC